MHEHVLGVDVLLEEKKISSIFAWRRK